MVLLQVTLLVAVGSVVVLAGDMFLILFLAVLFGVFLTKCSVLLQARLPLGYATCLGCVVTVLLLLAAGGLVLFGVQIDAQLTCANKHLDKVQKLIQQAADASPLLGSTLQSTPYIKDVLLTDGDGSENEGSDSKDSRNKSSQNKDSEGKDPQGNGGDSKGSENKGSSSDGAKDSSSTADSGQGLGPGKQDEDQGVSRRKVLKKAAKSMSAAIGSIFKTSLGIGVNTLLVFFVGLFLAVAPTRYRDGVVKLFPPARRERIRDLMDLLGSTLWHWLLGRFGSMLVTGGGAALILLLLGVPLALPIGLVTALLTFIPNIGGVIALLLALLAALPQGATTMGIVLGAYLLLQLIESYIVTPLIQRQQVSLPPALLIAFQAVFSMVFGLLGAAVSSPLLAAAKVTVEELYIKDRLEAGAEKETEPSSG